MTRGHPLSNDLRQALIHMGTHQSLEDIQQFTGIPRSTLYGLYAEYRRNGHILRSKPTIETRGRPRKFRPWNARFLAGSIRRKPDYYLDELKELVSTRLGMDANEATIWRTLQRSGYTMKNLTKAAIERNEERRLAFRFTFGLDCNPYNCVFVDESSFDRRTTLRKRAWALRGRRAERKWFFVRGKRYSLLPALTTQGIIHARVVEGSFTMVRFRSFIERLLDRMDEMMEPGAFIIMDNARIHHDDSIVTLVEDRGYHIMYLPPYSPDYNPIELAFSAIKAYVRRMGVLGRDPDDEDDTYVYLHLLEAAYSITQSSAQGFYHHCRYI